MVGRTQHDTQIEEEEEEEKKERRREGADGRERVARSAWKKKKSVEREGEKWMIYFFSLLLCFDFFRGASPCVSTRRLEYATSQPT